MAVRRADPNTTPSCDVSMMTQEVCIGNDGHDRKVVTEGDVEKFRDNPDLYLKKYFGLSTFAWEAAKACTPALQELVAQWRCPATLRIALPLPHEFDLVYKVPGDENLPEAPGRFIAPAGPRLPAVRGRAGKIGQLDDRFTPGPPKGCVSRAIPRAPFKTPLELRVAQARYHDVFAGRGKVTAYRAHAVLMLQRLIEQLRRLISADSEVAKYFPNLKPEDLDLRRSNQFWDLAMVRVCDQIDEALKTFVGSASLDSSRGPYFSHYCAPLFKKDRDYRGDSLLLRLSEFLHCAEVASPLYVESLRVQDKRSIDGGRFGRLPLPDFPSLGPTHALSLRSPGPAALTAPVHFKDKREAAENRQNFEKFFATNDHPHPAYDPDKVLALKQDIKELLALAEDGEELGLYIDGRPVVPSYLVQDSMDEKLVGPRTRALHELFKGLPGDSPAEALSAFVASRRRAVLG